MKYIIRLFILIFFLTSCDYSLYNPFIIIEENSPLKILGDIRLTNDTYDSNQASLIWTGTEYGVCWSDDRDGNSEIYFTRISSSGDKIGTDNRITNSNGHSVTPSLVWTGTEYGVSWEDSRDATSREIYFARISASGVKQGSDERITNYISEKYNPSLVWANTEYGVCWEDYRDGDSEIYFARIDAGGTKIGSDIRLTNALVNSRSPSLVWNGTEYGVCWHDSRDGGDFEIYFTRLDYHGVQQGSDIRITNNSFSSIYTSLVWTGTEYGVSWQDNRDGNYQIYFTRIDSLGNKIGTDIRITNAINESLYPSLVWGGTGYGVSWQDNRDGNYQIYFARIDSLGNKIGSDIRITNVPFDSFYPSLVRNGNGYGVSWHDGRDLNNEIYYVKLSPTGTKL